MKDKTLLSKYMSAYLQHAISNMHQVSLAEIQAQTALHIQEKARLRKPYELKIIFCKKCKNFSPPGIYSTIRLNNGKMVITCRRCGSKYRLIYKK